MGNCKSRMLGYWKAVVTALLVVTFLQPATAQYKSRLGRFEVDQKKGCAPFRVNITATNLVAPHECSGSTPCLMTPGDAGATQQNQLSIVYNTPGVYTLSILYQSIGADDIVITVDENIQPDFDVYACSGNRASIKVTDNHYDQYVIDFQNDGTPENVIPFGNNATAQFNYGTAGTFNISVRGRDLNSADNCSAQVQSYSTIPTIPTPTITALTSVDPTSLKLDFVTQNDIQYKLEVAVNNSNTFQVLQTLYEVNTYTVANLLLDNNYYCFRLSAYDPCANANNYSNIICSQDFDLSFRSGASDLTWRTSTIGVTNVEIIRNAASYTSIPGAPTSFVDLDTDCNTPYCYRVVSHYPGGVRSTSLEKCGTAFVNTDHPAISNVSATVDGGVTLTWTSPNIKIKEYDIWRSSGGGPVSMNATTPQGSPYKDANYTTEGAYCYQINYRDFCANNSLDGIITCPLRLLGNIDPENVVTLYWTRYKGWQGGVASYIVEKYNKAGALIRTFNMGTDTTLIDDQPDLTNQVVSYKVRATPVETGPTQATSNTITFVKEVNLTFPTAFTPNEDKLNDLFTITSQYVAKMNVKIFDRWGALVFASEKNEPWDGKRTGIPMPEATYIWKAEITDLAGQTFSREGTLVLLRK